MDTGPDRYLGGTRRKGGEETAQLGSLQEIELVLGAGHFEGQMLLRSAAHASHGLNHLVRSRSVSRLRELLPDSLEIESLSRRRSDAHPARLIHRDFTHSGDPSDQALHGLDAQGALNASHLEVQLLHCRCSARNAAAQENDQRKEIPEGIDARLPPGDSFGTFFILMEAPIRFNESSFSGRRVPRIRLPARRAGLPV